MLVIIDGDCSFCQWASRWLKRLCLPELEIIYLSHVSSQVLQKWSSDPNWSVDSIKVISNNQLFLKSAAIAEIMHQARWFAQPLRFIFVLPERLLDVGYDWVARNRKSQQCEI
jgi:predicted DCC family thiol-disulfide oxidoreductase YuxK